MNAGAATGDASPGLLRRLLLGLGGVSAAGALAELGLERHWGSIVKVIPWFAIGVLLVALVLVAAKPNRPRLQLARGLCAVVALSSLVGVYKHVEENRKAGALDFRYADRWESLSAASQWWKAATKTVGPAPILAPGVLIQAAVSVAAATVGHPARRRG